MAVSRGGPSKAEPAWPFTASTYKLVRETEAQLARLGNRAWQPTYLESLSGADRELLIQTFQRRGGHPLLADKCNVTTCHADSNLVGGEPDAARAASCSTHADSDDHAHEESDDDGGASAPSARSVSWARLPHETQPSFTRHRHTPAGANARPVNSAAELAPLARARGAVRISGTTIDGYDRDRDASEMPIARASPPRPQSAPQLVYRTHHAVGRAPKGGSSGPLPPTSIHYIHRLAQAQPCAADVLLPLSQAPSASFPPSCA